MNIDRKSGVPLYKQIENYIRDEIESGKYDDGQFLPNEQDLAHKFGVSRNTVRQGIANLVHEGILKRTAGKGTVLAEKHITTHLAEWKSFSEEMLRKGVELKNYFIKVDYEIAPKKVYHHLQLKEKKKLLKLERLRGDIQSPFVYFVSWFNPKIKLTKDDDFSQPLYSILQDKYSVDPVYSEEELTAVPASGEISRYLKIKENAPILLRKRLVLNVAEKPIEYNIGYYRSDKCSYSIRFERK